MLVVECYLDTHKYTIICSIQCELDTQLLVVECYLDTQ